MPNLPIEQPPKMLHAYFAGDGSPYIDVRFDNRPTNKGATNGLFACSVLLSASTVQQLQGSHPDEPQCIFVDLITLRILLSARTEVHVGSAIELTSGRIHTHDASGCDGGGSGDRCVSGSVFVAVPTGATRPTAVISSPSVLSACDDLQLRGTMSYGGGIFPLRYLWNVSNASTYAAATAPALAQASAGGQVANVLLARQHLPAGTTLSFSLVVVSEIGGASDPAVVIVAKTVSPVVSVQIEGSLVQDSVRASEGASFLGHVSLPSIGCIDQAESLTAALRLEWTVVPSVASSGLVTLEGGHRLRILPGTLAPGTTYTLTLTAILPDGSKTISGNSASASIFAEASPLAVSIVGGISRTAGRDTPILLDAASASSDPDAPFTMGLAATFSWACALWPPGSPSDGPSTACPTPFVDTLASAAARGTGKAELPARQAQVGSRLRLTATATVGSRSATAVQEVTVVAGAPPSVQISGRLRVNPSEHLSLAASVQGTSSGACGGVALVSTQVGGSGACKADYAWSISPESWPLSPTTSVSLASARASKPGYPMLLLKPGSLPGGGSFTLTLSALDRSSGATGTARVIVSSNMPPYGGTLSVSPANATLGDTVVFTAAGFADDDGDLPLRYAFSTQSPRGGEARGIHLAGPMLSATHSESSLASGDALARVAVVDQYGASSHATAALSVALPQAASASVLGATEFVQSQLHLQLDEARQVASTLDEVKAVATLASVLVSSAGGAGGAGATPTGGALAAAPPPPSATSAASTAAARELNFGVRETMIDVLEHNLPEAHASDEQKLQMAQAATLLSQVIEIDTTSRTRGPGGGGNGGATDPDGSWLSHSDAVASLSASSAVGQIERTAEVLNGVTTSLGGCTDSGETERVIMEGIGSLVTSIEDALAAQSSTARTRRRATEVRSLALASAVGQRLAQTLQRVGRCTIGGMAPGQSPATFSTRAVELGVMRDYSDGLTNCSTGAPACCTQLSPLTQLPDSERPWSCIPLAIEDGMTLNVQVAAYTNSPFRGELYNVSSGVVASPSSGIATSSGIASNSLGRRLLQWDSGVVGGGGLEQMTTLIPYSSPPQMDTTSHLSARRLQHSGQHSGGSFNASGMPVNMSIEELLGGDDAGLRQPVLMTSVLSIIIEQSSPDQPTDGRRVGLPPGPPSTAMFWLTRLKNASVNRNRLRANLPMFRCRSHAECTGASWQVTVGKALTSSPAPSAHLSSRLPAPRPRLLHRPQPNPFHGPSLTPSHIPAQPLLHPSTQPLSTP